VRSLASDDSPFSRATSSFSSVTLAFKPEFSVARLSS
jgi:hypothetical protein